MFKRDELTGTFLFKLFGKPCQLAFFHEYREWFGKGRTEYNWQTFHLLEAYVEKETFWENNTWELRFYFLGLGMSFSITLKEA